MPVQAAGPGHLAEARPSRRHRTNKINGVAAAALPLGVIRGRAGRNCTQLCEIQCRFLAGSSVALHKISHKAFVWCGHQISDDLRVSSVWSPILFRARSTVN